MTLPYEKDNALKHAMIFLSAVLRNDKQTVAGYGNVDDESKVHIPKWLKSAAARILRHYPSIDEINYTRPFEGKK